MKTTVHNISGILYEMHAEVTAERQGTRELFVFDIPVVSSNTTHDKAS